MRACDPTENPILGSVSCNYTALAIGAVVASVAIAGIGMVQQASAASQASASAQQMAAYNAQIQQQNAQVAYQMQVAQAEQANAAAQANFQLSQFNQQQQASIAAANQQLLSSQSQVSQMNAMIQRRNAGLMEANATLAASQAAFARKQYDAELSNAATLDKYAEAQRAQSREETRRIREETDRRMAVIHSKYSGSGVTFEGSPLVVLADAARLAETSAQDQAYIGELESRKTIREAELTRFKAGYSLIDEAGFMSQSAGYQLKAAGSRLDAFASRVEAYGYGVKSFEIGAQAAMYDYQSEIEQANFLNQQQSANYDEMIAGAKYKIALNEAELTRYEGSVQSAAYKAQGTASLISGFGSMASSIGGLGTSMAKRPSTPGYLS